MPPQFHGIELDSANRVNERTITVRNKSGAKAAYYLVNAGLSAEKGPSSGEGVASNDPLGPWLRCVYQASEQTAPSTGSCTFRVEDTFFGICGSGQGALTSGTPLFANDAANVVLATPSSSGTRLLMTMSAEDEASFITAATTQNAMKVPGAFGITVDSTFRFPNASEFSVAHSALPVC